MARIAITGGTGFVGIHTVRRLRAEGHELRLVARGTRTLPRLEGTEVVRADVAAGDRLVEVFNGCDAVVHLTAIIREKGRQTFARVNAQGARNVAQAAKAANVAHIVHVSALGVTPNPRYAYLESKWEGEQAVRGSGVPYTVLRPSLMFGPGDGFFTKLTRLVRLNPVVPLAGDGRAMFQPIAVDDVTRIIALCLQQGPAHRVHEIGGPDHLSYKQIIDVIRTELGVHRLTAPVPLPLMLPAATLMARLLPNPPVTPGELRLLELNNITRPDAVRSLFGFEPLRFADHCSYLHDY